jgi:ankyrin repeat protein
MLISGTWLLVGVSSSQPIEGMDSDVVAFEQCLRRCFLPPVTVTFTVDGPMAEARGDRYYETKIAEERDSASAQEVRLFGAIFSGDSGTVWSLIPSTFSVNYRTSFGLSPVWAATGCGRLDIVEDLLNMGAVLNPVLEQVASRTQGDGDEDGDEGPPGVYMPKAPLLLAAWNNDLTMAQLLLRRGALPNGVSNAPGLSPILAPLHLAALRNAADIAPLLVFHGADPNAKCFEGATPLHLAIQTHGREARDFCALLLASGADVNRQDDSHRTALVDAIYSGSAQLIRLLVNAGANVNYRWTSARGKTWCPLRLAASLPGREDVAAVLREAGAKEVVPPDGQSEQ